MKLKRIMQFIILFAVSVVFAPVVYAVGQMLSDPGFELSLGNGTWPSSGFWLPSSSGGGAYALCVANGIANHSGSNGLWDYTDGGTAASWSAPYQQFTSAPGKYYNASSWVRRKPDGSEWVSGSKVYVRVEFRNSSNVLLTYIEGSPQVTDATPAGTWVQSIVSNAQAPANTAYVRFLCYVDKPAVTGVSVGCHDDCFFEQLNTAPNAPTLTGPANDGWTGDNTPTFTWTFSDPDAGDTQTTFQWQADDVSGFGSPNYDSGEVALSAGLYTPGSAMADGTWYWRVRTKDSYVWGNYSSPWTVKIDATSPATPTVTDDGTYTSSNSSLHATWSSSDSGSGIAEYQYAIGTSAGGTDTATWMSTGTQTNVTRTGLSLTNGQAYYFTVKARDAVSNWSTAGNSNGIIVDASVPTAPGTPTDIGQYTTSTSVTWNWTAASAPSGIKKYYFCIGTTPGGTNILNDFDVGNVLTTSTVLASGYTYYAKVKAQSNTDLVGPYSASSDGIMVDTSPPAQPTAPSDEGAYKLSTTINFNWAAASDLESGIASYWLKVSTTEGGNDVFDADVGNVLTKTFTGCQDSKMYFAQVKAKNNAGLWSNFSVVSDGILIDTATLAASYPVYWDAGLPPGVTGITGVLGSETLTEPTTEGAPEKTKCFKTVIGAAGYGGWYISLSTPAYLSFHRNNNGEIRFWVKTPVDLVVKIKDNLGIEKSSLPITSTSNKWREKRILLANIPNVNQVDFSQIKMPFLIATSTTPGAGTTFLVDYVRWVVPSTGTPAYTGSFNVNSDAGSAGFVGVYKGGSDNFSIVDDYGTYTEGTKSMNANYNITASGWGGWYVEEGGEGGSQYRYMSSYDSGYLRFWVKASTDLVIGIRSDNISAGERSKVLLSDYRIPVNNTWQEAFIPVRDFRNKETDLDLSKMEVYFNSAVDSAYTGAISGNYWIDDVRWLTTQSVVAVASKIYAGLQLKQNATTGLVRSYETLDDAVTYDQALAAMQFTYRGDFSRAAQILDRYLVFYNSGYDGFRDSYNVSTEAIIDADRASGPNAWMLLALMYYKKLTGATGYDSMITVIAGWLNARQDADGGIKWGWMSGAWSSVKSTEHNLSCYAAFKNLYKLTGNATYDLWANNIKSWLDNSVWVLAENRFKAAAGDNGKALDCYSWAVAVLKTTPYTNCLTSVQTDFRNIDRCDLTGANVDGFDFDTNKDSVWLEGSAQMILAYKLVGDNASASSFLGEMEKAVSEIAPNIQGFAYATSSGTAYGGWTMDSVHQCVSSAVWYLFARDKFNPFWPLPEITTTIKRFSDGVSVSSITWSGVSAGDNGWKAADRYIEISVSPNFSDWGIQIYTDNKNASASPQYAGPLASGFNLVGTIKNKQAIPMCWMVVDILGAPATPVERSDGLGFTNYFWKWMKDVQQTADLFINDESYVRVWDDGGIYLGESGIPTVADAPNYIYIAAKFDGTVAQEYRTNLLILELYRM